MVLHYKLYNASIILFLSCFVFVASIPSKELNGKVHGYLFPLPPGRKNKQTSCLFVLSRGCVVKIIQILYPSPTMK